MLDTLMSPFTSKKEEDKKPEEKKPEAIKPEVVQNKDPPK